MKAPSKFAICIPSMGRAANQKTLDSIPKHLKARTYVFVRKSDEDIYEVYKGWENLVVLSGECVDLGSTRQWILNWCWNNYIKVCVMSDDDLKFYRRQGDGKFVPTNNIEDLVDSLVECAKSITLVGIPGRFLANNLPRVSALNKRPACFFAINVEDVMKSGVKYGTIKVQIDIKFGLELLLKGYSNVQLTEWAHDQKFDAPGGCSNYRTAKVLTAASHQLKKEFPDFVTVVEKKASSFKNASVDGVRTEVRVQWAKAAKYGANHASY